MHEIKLKKEKQEEANRVKESIDISSIKGDDPLMESLKLLDQLERDEFLNHSLDSERRRIAEALHNGVGQLLYCARLKLERLKSISNPLGECGDIYTDIEALLEESIKETRIISFQLVPVNLEKYGIAVALKEFIRKVNKGFCSIDFVYNLNRRLNIKLENSVFRIVQELINNVIKHSKATKAEIEIEEIENILKIKVQDNGKGFNLDSSINLKDKMGLKNIYRRVQNLEGNIEIQSLLNVGTTIKIEIKSLNN